MPVYHYKCSDCEHEFEVKHRMSFEEQKCIKCFSSSVFKKPSLSERIVYQPTNKRAGKVVDKYIDDVKKEVKDEKRRLSSEEI
tara:strand:+ start:857 stop:1105 length:249 start_codon:yes stop_codon:yes gene_type:complete